MQEHIDFSSLGKEVLRIEAEAITDQLYNLDHSFNNACELLLSCKGRVVVIGIGKSGHIGGKIAATLASTGTPAFFVHPGDASHGDLGMITSSDVVLALSNSGESNEILGLLPVIKRLGVPMVAMTGSKTSTMAINSTVHIEVAIKKEACPLDLVPTASSTAALAMGDALAISLLTARGFEKEDFALSHPGGRLGRRLLLYVDDIIHQDGEFPSVSTTTSISDALLEMTRSRLGMTAVLTDSGELVGIFTDGDLRRTIEAQVDLRLTAISEVMTENCITIPMGTLAFEALKVMEDNKINGLIIVDNNVKPVGAINMYDLLKAGVV
ncbi:MAG: KpsF/GutQ family sugar-phosphate isomerase [Gammaproteobacteria bacterium]|nr:KpsF/GutQ family sugar-phosphate isomerase [Gammaproteobacteria bacterium]